MNNPAISDRVLYAPLIKQSSSSAQIDAQSGKIKDSSSRVRYVNPADTIFVRFEGSPPKRS